MPPKKLESEADTKFDLPRAVDLGRASRGDARVDRSKVGLILQVQVRISEPRMVHDIAKGRDKPGIEPFGELDLLRYGQVQVPVGLAAKRPAAAAIGSIQPKYEGPELVVHGIWIAIEVQAGACAGQAASARRSIVAGGAVCSRNMLGGRTSRWI